jgi:SAM-dependent methyltransferase
MDADTEPGVSARARELLDRFLTERSDRTAQAYQTDLDDFARFLGTTRAAAAAGLLAGGPHNAQRVVLEYAIDQRRRERAPATIVRRLWTLRALARCAYEADAIRWQLELPSHAEISAAMERTPARDNEHYLLPRHPGEVDRLDVQHYVIRETLGANFLAPVEGPARILDVGCGTGQWGFEMCQHFPDALVVGLDLVSGKTKQPPRYRYVRANLLQGLPFAEDQFDFVHQRFLVSGLPIASWPAVVADLARVTRPGGWVELVEVPWAFERPGPAAERLMGLVRELLVDLKLDSTDVVYRTLDAYLGEAGLVNVERHEVSQPIGRWGGTVGSLMATDCRSGATRVCEVLQARGKLGAAEAWDLVQAAHEEWENGRMAYPAAIAFGQKPSP